jgi:hypothetical protein
MVFSFHLALFFFQLQLQPQTVVSTNNVLGRSSTVPHALSSTSGIFLILPRVFTSEPHAMVTEKDSKSGTCSAMPGDRIVGKAKYFEIRTSPLCPSQPRPGMTNSSFRQGLSYTNSSENENMCSVSREVVMFACNKSAPQQN